MAYPVIDEEVVEFCRGKRAVLLVEEGQPDFIEQNINTVLRRADVPTVLPADLQRTEARRAAPRWATAWAPRPPRR
ncbi:Indolepyruvate ferredoxin oxidoreductase, alpha and beta subunits [Mycobacteroides abscessus subsp. abscessus]|nr:Indolepyruvate ferredoxin oxidoreductase, alpha and beta subunits [Mycobacteroides abscessus subsp. abscessus]